MLENWKNFYLKYRNTLWKVLVLFMAMCALCLLFYQPFMDILDNKEEFKVMMDSFGIWAYVIYICVNMLQVFLAFIPGEVVEVLAGFCFGTINGTIACLIASGLASTIVFCLVREFGGKIVATFVKEENLNEISFLKNEANINVLAFIVFLIPGTPKDLFTYFLPLTSIKYSQFIWIVTLARIPSIITSTIAGEAIINMNIGLIIGVYVITGVIGVIGILWYQRMIKRKKEIKCNNA